MEPAPSTDLSDSISIHAGAPSGFIYLKTVKMRHWLWLSRGREIELTQDLQDGQWWLATYENDRDAGPADGDAFIIATFSLADACGRWVAETLGTRGSI